MARKRKTEVSRYLPNPVTMHHKGYTGVANYQEDILMYFGEVINIDDVVTFMSDSFVDLPEAFHDSVDEYMEFINDKKD